MKHSRFASFGYFFILFILTTSCTKSVDIERGSGGSVLSGTIDSLNASSSQKVNGFAVTCVDPMVDLYFLEEDDTTPETPAATTTVGSDGSYTFRLGRGNPPVDTNSPNYIIKVRGCSSELQRIITGRTQQNITLGTTVVALAKDIDDPSKKPLSTLPNSEINNLAAQIDGLSGANLSQIISQVAATPAVSSQFNNLINTQFNNLEQLPPPQVTITKPSPISEDSTTSYSVNSTHWNGNYSVAYEWYVDGVFKNSASSMNFPTTKNSQGVKNFELRVGANNGSNFVDATKPYKTIQFPITITNSVPATVPALSLVSPAFVNTPTATVRLNTGAALANCETFSTIAFNNDITNPPVLLSDFSFSCSTSPQQNYNVSLPAGDGVKVIAAWTKDSAQNISLSSTSVTVTLDQTNPSISMNNLPTALKGGSSTPVTFTAADATSGLASVNLSYTSDNVTFVPIASNATSPQSWTVPSINQTVSVRAIVTDNAGNTSTLSSNSLTIDSTAPTAPTLSRTSAALSNSTTVAISVTCIADYAMIHFAESAAVPSENSSGWETCSSTKNFTVSSTNGVHTIYGFTKDAVGNISTSNSVSMTLDQTAPSLALTSLNSGIFKGGSSQNITWTLSDTHLAANSIVADYSIDNGTSWISISTAFSNTGPLNWTLPSVNSNQVLVRLRSTDQAGNTATTQSSSALTIDSTAPAMELVQINNGDVSTSVTFTNVKVKATDNFSATVSYKLDLANPVTGDCQSEYSNTNWSSFQSSGTEATIPYSISSSDGVKKVCVWVKDELENISIFSPTQGAAGIDNDSINFFIGNPPTIANFEVVNHSTGTKIFATGDTARISWTINDIEALDNNPITLEYTTDNNTWVSIVSNYGGLSGNPTTYTLVYTGWTIPPSINTGFFRVRVRAKDASGNTSLPVLSDTMNTEADPIRKWSIFAGSRDIGIGGNARALYLSSTAAYHRYVVSPVNGDIYALSISNYGGYVLKINAATGTSSIFLTTGTTNLPTAINSEVTIPASPLANIGGDTNLYMDSKGRLYVREAVSSATSARIWQFDFSTNKVRLYLGSNNGTAGTVDNGSATPGTAFVATTGGFWFDAQDNLYFLTFCGGTWVDTSTTARRILKVSQNTDGSSGTVSAVAGDCTFGNPVSGTASLSTPLTTTGSAGDFTGASVSTTAFYYRRSASIFKVINGISYTTSISIGSQSTSNYGLDYNPVSNKLYLSRNGTISECTINLAGANGEVCTVVVDSTGNFAGCRDDGVGAASSCVKSHRGLKILSDGTLTLAEGMDAYSIRYLDTTSKIRTLAGSQPFYGDGLDKRFARGIFRSLYYKKSTEPNQTAFPEGLYFTSRSGPVWGRIESNGIINVLYGNQVITGGYTITTGTPINKSLSMGVEDVFPSVFSFDNTGLPWIAYGDRRLLSIDSSGNAVSRLRRTTGGAWNAVPDGSNPTAYSLDAYAGNQNFSFKDQQLFFYGTYHSLPGQNNPNPVLKLWDFSSLMTKHIMGGTGTTSNSNITTASDISAATISSSCRNDACSLQFVENGAGTADDILYISEGTLLRRITDPTTVGNSTLVTLFTAPAAIQNFTVSPDNKRIFFVRSNKLYCHSLAPGDVKTWCPQSSWVDLGPSNGIRTISRGANQFAWKDDSTLYIANDAGEILQYVVPSVP